MELLLPLQPKMHSVCLASAKIMFAWGGVIAGV